MIVNKYIPLEKSMIKNTDKITSKKSDKKENISNDSPPQPDNNGKPPEENSSKNQISDIQRHSSDIPLTGNAITALPKKPLFGILMIIALTSAAVHTIKKRPN